MGGEGIHNACRPLDLNGVMQNGITRFLKKCDVQCLNQGFQISQIEVNLSMPTPTVTEVNLLTPL